MNPHQPYYPPPVYVPAPADPLDFHAAEPDPPPRPRRRRTRTRRPNGLVIALVVMAAVGLSWFGYVSVRNEWDRARLQDIPDEIRSVNQRIYRLVGPEPYNPSHELQMSPPPGADWEKVQAGREKRDRQARAEYERQRAAWEASLDRPDVRALVKQEAALEAERTAILRRHPEWRSR